MTNNSLVRFDDGDEVEKSPVVEERETFLISVIELLQRVRLSEDWSSLKQRVFDGLTAKLEKELRDEAMKEDPNTNRLNRLSGELKWSRRFSDLEEYEKTLRVELAAIRKRYGKSE